jgi:inhibitor of KinA
MKIFWVGDSAVCVEFGPQIDIQINQKAIEYAAQLESQNWPEVVEVVPAYSSVTIYLNDIKISRIDMTSRLRGLLQTNREIKHKPGRIHRIPVTYGGDFGPDLDGVAVLNGISTEEVVRIHTATEFRVFMLGFMPGFPYCGIVPEKIRAPRLASPRTRVPKSSVGIAGAQTGIYPMESPGGWQLIGRTPVSLFDSAASKEKMFLFEPGDRIQFYSIAAEEFHDRSN